MEDIKKLQKKFGKIITKWLEKRDNTEFGDFSDESIYGPSEEDSFYPNYVMNMMKEINSEMPKDILDEIKKAETNAMGHVDYFHKFSFYCAELYLKYINKN